MQKSFNPTTPKLVGSVVITAVMLIAIYTLILQPNADEEGNATRATNSTVVSSTADTDIETVADALEDTPTTAAPTTALSTPSKATPAVSAYKDGTYEVATSYQVPKGHSNGLDVSVTITGGVITAVSTTSATEDSESSRYISGFENALEAEVLNESVDEISIGRIGGASLTSKAFEAVLADIIAKARS